MKVKSYLLSLPERLLRSAVGISAGVAREVGEVALPEFETSSMLALSAADAFPERVRWLSASTRVGATRAGQVLGAVLLDQYRQTLVEIQQVGYATYAARHLWPYLHAAAHQFSPRRRALTERRWERLEKRRSRAES